MTPNSRSKSASPAKHQPALTYAVRFALSGELLPPVTDTLLVGDLARASVMSRYGRQNDGKMSAILAGKDQAGKPLKGHRHAFYLPTDDDGDGYLDHLTVWIPAGLQPDEFGAIMSVNSLHPGSSGDILDLVYIGHRAEDDFAEILPLFRPSPKWRSLTPYVLPRHVKYRGSAANRRIVDGPEAQIAREVGLRFSDVAKLSDVKIIDHRLPIAPSVGEDSNGFRPRDFYRRRGRGSSGGGAFNFVLQFDRPVRGPLVLGFGCHFGLGIFVPA